MDRIITSTQANQRFSEMLRDVAGGESFTVTSRGRPIARVTPPAPEAKKKDITELLDMLKALPRRTYDWTREDLYERRPDDV